MAARKTRFLTFMFDPRGRTTRVGFLVGMAALTAFTLVWGLACAVVMTVATVAVLHLQRGDPLAQALVVGTALLIAAPVIWSSIAMSARRLRDAGLPVIAVCVLMMAIPFLDKAVLVHFTNARFVWPFPDMTPLGGAVTAAVWLVLLLMPARRSPEPARRTADVFA